MKIINHPGIIVTILIVILFVVCTPDQNNTAKVQNKKLVLQMNRELWNNGNLSVIEKLFSTDFIYHFLPDSTEFKGIDSLREQVRKHRKAFPDWKENIKHIVTEGDFVIIQFESSGTNLGNWLGNPPTGKKVHIDEFSIFRVKDGKIAEQWLMPDLYSLRRQLGEDSP